MNSKEKKLLKARKRTKRAGLTILELLVSSTISFLALTGAVAMLVAGTSTWYKGEGKMLAETQSQRTVRMISGELREAMAVTVDGNGLGLSYRLPTINGGTGSYNSPATWDNVPRRIEYSDGTIRVVTNGVSRTICRNVILTDPQSVGNASYVIFAAGSGVITRRLTVMVATQTSTTRGGYTKSRSRETIYLRNIPELSRG